jgi:hypothetical protein
MKVKIGNKIYDSKDEPIMIIFNDYEKIDISTMEEDEEYEYCVFPDHIKEEEILRFMND